MMGSTKKYGAEVFAPNGSYFGAVNGYDWSQIKQLLAEQCEDRGNKVVLFYQQGSSNCQDPIWPHNWQDYIKNVEASNES